MNRTARAAADAAYAQRQDGDRVVIHLPIPPSVNHLYGNTWRGRGKTAGYRHWIKAAGTILDKQRPRRIPGRYALSILIDRSSSGADLSNIAFKAVEDLLVTHGVIRDDSLSEQVTALWGCVPEGARIELTWVPAVGTSQPLITHEAALN